MTTAMAENFFSILKVARIYRYKSATFAEIHWMVTNIFPFTTTSASGKKNGRGAASELLQIVHTVQKRALVGNIKF